MGSEDRPPGQGGPEPGSGSGPAGATPGADPGELLSDLSRLRRRTRTARHGYWFPLLLFGVLTAAAAPLYLAAASVPATSGSYQVANTGPMLLSGLSPGPDGFYIGWYWTVALVIGFLLTVLWYRRRARQAGVRTPARGYLITGIVLTVLAVVLPPLSRYAWWLAILWAPIGDAWVRGTFGFLIIAAGLWVLVRAERSRGLAVIALIYTAAALLSSLYNIENVLFRLGWNPGNSPSAWSLSTLPDVLLPAAVLLVAGLSAFFVQRRRRPA
jgi:hypothetical protein